MFGGAQEMEFAVTLKRRTIVLLQMIQADGHEEMIDNLNDELQDYDRKLLKMQPAKDFHGPDGLEVKMMRGFELTCIMLRQRAFHSTPRTMGTISFYHALHTLKEQQKPRK